MLELRQPEYKDALGRFNQLSVEVSRIIFPVGTSRRARGKLDFSGEQFYLESLEGPDGGIVNSCFRADLIEFLNISRNQLTTLQCLNHRNQGRLVFSKLSVLIASYNMLTEVKLEHPTLLELNLSHNELQELPCIQALTGLQKLVVSNNYIDGTLEKLEQNTRLRYLDISNNKFSWKPSLFKRQLDALKQCHIEELRIWPNPFAQHFTEYQFLTVAELNSITYLDDYHIDNELRDELRIQNDKFQARVDYTVFDVKVEERARSGMPVEQSSAEKSPDGEVPALQELTATLSQCLDRPTELMKHIHTFEDQVRNLWAARFWDRQQRVSERREPGQKEGTARRMKPEEETQAVAEFGDSMQQALGRFDTVQDVLVMCLVRLLACGSALLSQRCAQLLAEWIDAASAEIQSRMLDMSNALFQDLASRTLPGAYSINEPPFACYEASQGNDQWLRACIGEGEWADPEQVAEAAGILTALGKFGSLEPWATITPPFRALVLRPFIPVICRESRKKLGPNHPSDGWAAYRHFDAFPEDTVMTLDIVADNLKAARERCVRQGYGGFTACEDQPGKFKIRFKAHSPDTLVGTRLPCEGTMLHVRPSATKKSRGRGVTPKDMQYQAWQTWEGGLKVLRMATSDRNNAALCVRGHNAHVTLMLQDQHKHGWRDAWMLNTAAATRAFTISMQVVVNLVQAAGEAGLQAARYFVEHKLHMNCWMRVRRRVLDGASPLSVEQLSEANTDLTTLVATLISVICALCRVDPELAPIVIGDVKSAGLDLFDRMLDIAASPGIPDPLILSASFDLIYAFINEITMRISILEKVLDRVRDGDAVFPYLRGPMIGDHPNTKFQKLWLLCETKYAAESSARERMPELWETGVGDLEERSRWTKRVPELRNLQHPVMHRVLLAILSLIEFISSESSDPMLQRAAMALNRQGREELLIGPAAGVVTCPDFSVKASCLRCVAHVFRNSPEQFDLEEMGWLLRFVTTSGISIPKQQEFLANVLDLISLLICNQQRTGKSFRARFAKSAIREAFEMLRVIAKRGAHGSVDEQASRLKFGIEIVDLLKSCSRPLSGGLRKFLRRIDLLNSVIEVLEAEEKFGIEGPGAELLLTWTGRDVRQILLPLVTGNALHLSGVGRFRALVRLADVLESRMDYQPADIFCDVGPTDERRAWASLTRMQKAHVLQDPTEEEDWILQQRRFLAADGFWSLLHFMWRYSEAIGLSLELDNAYERAQCWHEDADRDVRRWWRKSDVAAKQSTIADKKQPDVVQTDLERCFDVRLRAICPRVSTLFGYNLNVYDESTKSSSLAGLAQIMAITFQSNHKKHKKQYAEYQKAYDELMSVPNQYYVSSVGKLMPAEDIVRNKLEKRIRQESNDINALSRDAVLVQKNLKRALIAGGGPHFDQKALDWANADFEDYAANRLDRRLNTGLAAFLRDHGAAVIDPGLLPPEAVRRLHKFKFGGDNTRLRNISRLMISYPNVEELLLSLNEMKFVTAFSIMRIRNQFASPSNFAGRTVIVNVETEIENGRFLSELQLVVRDRSQENSKQDMYAQRAKLGNDLKRALISSCQVREQHADEVAGFLIQQVESRSLHSGDVTVLRCMDQNLEAQGEDVSLFTKNVTTKHLFTIERAAGSGPIAGGDLIYLKSRATNKYVDVGSNNTVHCRFSDSKTESSNLLFVIERETNHSGGDGRVGGYGSVGLFAQAQNPGRQEGCVGLKNLHTRQLVRFRVHGSQRYLAAMTTTNWVGSAERLRIKAQALEPGQEMNSQFTVLRDGSVTDYLKLEDHGGEVLVAPAQDTSDEKLRRTLLEAHMCASMPTYDLCPREGGVFFRPPPLFGVVAEILAARDSPPGDGQESQPDQDKEKIERMPQMVAAILRCIYVLIQLPGAVGASEYALAAMFNRDNGTFIVTKLFALVTYVQRVGKNKEDLPDVLDASLSAKFLRLLSASLAKAPFLCSPIHLPGDADDEPAQQHEEHDRADGKHCRQRVALLHVITKYMRELLVPSLLVRLDSARWGSSLSSSDVTVLREFAIVVTTIAHNLFACEMRTGVKDGGVADVAAVLDAASPARPTHAAAAQQPQQSQFMQQGVVAGVQGVAAGVQGLAVGVESLAELAVDHLFLAHGTPALTQSKRADIFVTLLSSTLVRVLVHALLYGVHQEAVAFSEGQVQREVSIRLNSSLVDHCICALGAVMTGCDSQLGEGDVDYDVCEAISQAMSNSTQIVPRARMAQLMHERATDHFRQALQSLLAGGLVPDARPSERVSAIARAWFGPASSNETPIMPFCIVAVTSRLNLLVVQLPADIGDADTKQVLPDMKVLSFRKLRQLKCVILNPRIRQFMGLWWQTANGLGSSEVMIFENSARSRAFQEAMQIVPGDTMYQNPNGTSREEPGLPHQRGGIPVVAMQEEVTDSMEMTSKKDRGPDVNIISVMFVRSQQSSTNAGWGCGTVTARSGPKAPVGQSMEVEVLLLSTDTVCVISLRSFLHQYARYHDAEFHASQDVVEWHFQDSDSEDDEVPNFGREKHLHAENLEKMQALRGSPWQFGSLQGVWFLAEAESKARLQFGKEVEEIYFTSDGERQRFRRQLANALSHLEQRERTRGPSTWSVMPSDKTNLNEVKKHAKGLRVQGKQVPALGDAVRRAR